MGQTSVERLDVLQTSFPTSPSWIQDGEVGNDVIQDLGRVFRPPLRRAAQNGGPSASGRHFGWPHLREPEMRSSKMATGSGRAAILRCAPQWGRKTRPILLLSYLRKDFNCVMSMWRNYIKCENMFVFPLKYLAWKELVSRLENSWDLLVR